MSSKLDKNRVFSGMATEHTLKEVVTAVKSINLNVGSIAFGDVSVQSDDVTTHGKLDLTNSTIGVTNNKLEDVKTKLDTLNTTVTNKTLNKTTDSIDVSGQYLNVPLISGFTLDTTTQSTNTKLDTLNTSVNDKRINKTTDSIDVSGQYLNVPLISGFTLDTTTVTTNDVLNRILDKNGDVAGNIYYTEGASIWADTVPVPTINPLNPNGWLYTNTNAGNAMNLFYFNGVSETKTLSQVKGQYAIITNLSTKTNDSLIFGIYTKSATSFFTTRVTYSPNSGIDMIPGGRYLLFWGAVDEYIHPNLPRLNFQNEIVTGPANPAEEILSVTLNSNSSAPAGDVKISIETLGVVFDLEAREYNLLGSPTEYQTLVNINSSLSSIKTNTDKNKYTGEDLKTVISNIANTPLITGFATSELQTTGNSSLSDIKINSDKLLYDASGNLKVNVMVGGGGSGGNVTVDNIADTPLITGFALETGGNLASIKTNSDKNKYNGDNLKCEIPTTTTLGANVRDGAGTSITSTLVSSKRGLDCNIINTAVPVSSTTLATQSTLSSLNNKFSTDNIYNTSIKTVVNGEVIVSPVVSKPDYDLDLNSDLYAPAVFTASPEGLKGWRYQNSDPLLSSSIKYYANVPSVFETVQSDIDIYNNVSYFYAIIALDYIGDRTKTANLPYLTLATQVTGVDDFIPNIANTVYKYQFPASPFSLIKGEEIIVYWCENLGVSIPQSFMPNLRRFRLDYGGTIGGPGASSKLAYLSVDTALGVDAQGGQVYRLLGAGYKFTGTGGQTGAELNNAICDATFSVKNTIESNLSKLTFDVGTNALLVSSSGGGSSNGKAFLYSGNEINAITATDGSGSKVGIDSYIINSSLDTLCYGSSDGSTFHHLKTTTGGNLITESKTHDGANNAITSSLVSTKRGLDVNIIAGGGDSSTPQGTYNNIHSGNLTAITLSTPLNINNLYGNESVISYEDTAIGLTSFISILGSFDNSDYFYIGVLQPALIGTTVRQASAVLKLKGLKWIRILNTNATSTATAVKCTLFSG